MERTIKLAYIMAHASGKVEPEELARIEVIGSNFDGFDREKDRIFKEC